MRLGLLEFARVVCSLVGMIVTSRLEFEHIHGAGAVQVPSYNISRCSQSNCDTVKVNVAWNIFVIS